MNRLIEISTKTKLVTETCYKCHVLFAMPAEMQERCSNFGDTFYCPNGHAQCYVRSEVDILRDKLSEKDAALRYSQVQLNGALDKVAEKSKELRQIKRRVHAGVCPHCHRHFSNVERHIHSKHQDKLMEKVND
jgi:hypothetical protein